MLEPCEAKVSRTVLRGLGAGNRAWLLGQGGNRSDRAYHRTLPARLERRGNRPFEALGQWTHIRKSGCRLQVRVVQATKEGRWDRVRALQRLLTHSYRGKVLAVRRVTENNGKKTPGVDQEI